MYNQEKNSIIYLDLDKKLYLLNVLDKATKEVEGFIYRQESYRLKSPTFMESKLLLNGKRLIFITCERLNKNNLDRPNCFVDVYDLDSCQFMSTIAVRGSYDSCTDQENLLCLNFNHEQQLWDINQMCLIGSFVRNKSSFVLTMSQLGNKMIMCDNNNLVIWNCYQPTWEQFLLKQRIIWWWKTARTAQKFNSPEQWLSDVAKRFSLSIWDLISPFKSLAPEGCKLMPVKMPNGRKKLFSVLQASMWQTIQKRINRSQQYKAHVPSQI